ncbi:hypothetical protein N7468_002628 [Penicillium chermesinum]|uniref:Zn(2)-C6 fungal-type domain-containing protein n=1 Tax=Penicillium chermesinum TaxID=63820 RepID=A0A9W9TXT8_9EURO|nr:uncharacterized protein N7468_002628 [Penicillium chermesinum]KAJ5247645.1 hypothetical protein N7468_002628 [Penicillium chermesinum]
MEPRQIVNTPHSPLFPPFELVITHVDFTTRPDSRRAEQLSQLQKDERATVWLGNRDGLVKYPERHPVTIRLRLVCSGYTTSPVSQTQDIAKDRVESSKRKRTYRSCTACRASKTKCSGERPTCRRCHGKSLSCSYSESSQPDWIRRVEMSNKNPAAITQPGLVSDHSSRDRLRLMSRPGEQPDSSLNAANLSAGAEPGEAQTSPLRWYDWETVAICFMIR